jgi:hypothetical protein
MGVRNETEELGQQGVICIWVSREEGLLNVNIIRAEGLCCLEWQLVATLWRIS